MRASFCSLRAKGAYYAPADAICTEYRVTCRSSTVANLIVGLHPLPPQTRPQATRRRHTSRAPAQKTPVLRLTSTSSPASNSHRLRRARLDENLNTQLAVDAPRSRRLRLHSLFHAYQGVDCSWSYPKQGSLLAVRAASLAVRGEPLRIRGCCLNPARRRAGGILSGEFLRRGKRSIYRRIAAVVDAR